MKGANVEGIGKDKQERNDWISEWNQRQEAGVNKGSRKRHYRVFRKRIPLQRDIYIHGRYQLDKGMYVYIKQLKVKINVNYI
jgi:hypothetical protein